MLKKLKLLLKGITLSKKDLSRTLFHHVMIRIIIGILFVMVLLIFVFPPKVNISYSTIIEDSDGELIHAFLNDADKWRMYVELDEISPTLRRAIINKEDKYFEYHFGVNPLAIGRAFTNNLLQHKRTSGASTITMQVVRMLQPEKRTYFNKALEILRAIHLELCYSKDEILQLYLNLVPYGSNIEGIKSASYLYFQKSPDRLSLAEATTLAIIPNRPTSLRLGENNPKIIKERNKWLLKFKKSGIFSIKEIDDALKEPLGVFRHEAPKFAPHLAIRLKNSYPKNAIIRATIKKSNQQKIEQIVSNYVERIRAKNINNAAVMVLDNRSMEVVAYVGSGQFENTFDGGQVDGIRAIRSPGSALKPILYGLAFDKGLITPHYMINDVPSIFGGFMPENFDKKFNGSVSVSFALANSLNIPAVKILNWMGKKELIEALKKIQFSAIKKEEKKLGLSIVLGGCGVTLEEMTQLYASFANRGEWRTGQFIKNEPKQSPTRVLSSASVFMITEILSQIKRPDLPNNFDYTYRLPKVAWKTGTSFGRRDAWSIGYNKKYTVGVWVGNFSGEGVPELSGAEIATPLLFSIFNTLDYNQAREWFKQDKNVISRQVCAESGELPDEYCTNKILDYSIRGISHTRKCTHLKRVFVNYSESLSYCMQCLPETGYKEKKYANLAPELIDYYENQHIHYEAIPKHNPDCVNSYGHNKVDAPIIVSPSNNATYFINRDSPQKLQLSCQTRNDVKEVYWYIDEQLYQQSSPQKSVFFTPKMGKHKISCTDDRGRNSFVEIMVLQE